MPKSTSVGEKPATDRADKLWLYGFHAVRAALLNPRREKLHLLMTRNAQRRLDAQGITTGLLETIPHRCVAAAALQARLPVDATHQGLALQVRALSQISLSRLRGKSRLIFLDRITDPHNVGAILRTAAVFACDAVITTTRHSPPESGVLAKAASGALDRIAYVRITNLARAMQNARAEGFLIVGLDGDADTTLTSVLNHHFPFPGGLAFVLGAEGKGMRLRTRQLCDGLARLPGKGSLNVSNACAGALSILDTVSTLASPRDEMTP